MAVKREIFEKETPSSRVPKATTEAPKKVSRAKKTPAIDKDKEIAAIAYQLFVDRGCAHGYHEQDWLEAERQFKARK